MGKTLIVAEKPSVAADIAKVLGVEKSKDIFENKEYVISSAVGHLVGLAMPNEIDKKLGFWTLGALPIMPEKFPLKAMPNTKSKFSELKRLMNRKTTDRVINACDAGREGELIFNYIYELAECTKPVDRLWMQSMTKQSIITAFENLRPSAVMQNLGDAARCRSESDWLIGINGTRAVTKRTCGKGTVASVGRVQTPTLSMVYARELQIRSFVPRDFWRIESNFNIATGSYLGVYQRPDFRKSDDKHDRIDRMFHEPTAQKVFADLEANKDGMATVTETAKRTKSNPGQLYDLTSLQREANNRFGYSATRTLQIAQALYERHKMLTYPRTDSKALPEDYIDTCKETMAALGGSYAPFAKKVLSNNWIIPNKKIFNNAKISDHFAIIPTGQTRSLESAEQNIYDMVTKRFISVFYPPAQYDITKRYSEIAGHTFKTEGKVLAVSGYLEVYGKASSSAGTLPAITPADMQNNQAYARLVDNFLDAQQTKPPARYNEATLLSAMENAGRMVEDDELAEAMKEKGLGTPATRANIIEELCNKEYMRREEKNLHPTLKAEQMIEFLHRVNVDFLTQPQLTGEWEHKLSEIEQGTLTATDFMKGIRDLTASVVSQIKGWEDAGEVNTNLTSSTDGKPMLEKMRCYSSQDGELTIYKNIGGKVLTFEEIQALINTRKIGPLKGFVSKAGRPYEAFLFLDETNKVKFEFPPREGETAGPNPVHVTLVSLLENVKEWAEPVKAGKRVYDDKKFYLSLKDQSESRSLSEAQVNALKKIVSKYESQVVNYNDAAKQFGLETSESKAAAKAELDAMFTRLDGVTNWPEPSGSGRSKKDDKGLFESFRTQANRKGLLSPKQKAALEKLLTKYKV